MLLTGLFTLVGAAVVVPAQAAVDFAGKTITVVVSVPAGSGGDIVARQLSKIYVENLPGKPRVKVVNRPGGRGTVALNFIYEKGKPDGTTQPTRAHVFLVHRYRGTAGEAQFPSPRECAGGAKGVPVEAVETGAPSENGAGSAAAGRGERATKARQFSRHDA